jgi:tetratricopeptide (TPR) repeat protein
MSRRAAIVAGFCGSFLAGCATVSDDRGTLATLDNVEPDVDEIYVADSLERAAEAYRRYLDETPESARTPEAMRRLADLQLEQEYGVLGGGTDVVEMAAPETARPQAIAAEPTQTAAPPVELSESDQEFIARASERESFLAPTEDELDLGLGLDGEPIPAGPKEAIQTYWQILETYPNYERNDQVLYQLSRAYDEIGQPDEAMKVMDRLVAEYPYSKYVDEVYFRRGEYYFVRKKFLDAEESYAAVVRMGPTTSYYELALYKLGWTFYKQELYEEALHRYMAMLDHRLTIGYDFDQDFEENDEHRIADTFRVISLSFSNLGGPEVVDEYFGTNGHRPYADKIYGNLAEFYFVKLRYDDAASVYKSFIDLNPYHKVSPQFSMRVVEIYGEAGFPMLVVESKKEFATRYAVDAEYWNYFDIAEREDVVGFLKTNLTDLAAHYHALFQTEEFVDDRPQNFGEATQWYRQFLASFPEDMETPGMNYQFADLLLENEDFGVAAVEYERTAYEYETHEQSAAAGYAAVFAYRQHLDRATGASRIDIRAATVESSLRFADTFQAHEEAPKVLSAAADDLYDMQDFARAIESAEKLIARYPGTEPELLRGAWGVVAHSSMDTTEYAYAENAYTNLLALTPEEDEARPNVIDGLAASIYKQGEQANLLEDYAAAADHFLRIKRLAPTSAIRSSAEYDAAAAFMKLEDWTQASDTLEEFRTSHPEHELNSEATKQLAFIYREDGQTERSAVEHERIAAEAEDPELAREALLTAGELYDEVEVLDDAVRVYEEYVILYPRPLDLMMETRTRLAEIYKSQSDYSRYYDALQMIVQEDSASGADRTDRSRFLASQAALVLAEQTYERFARLELTLPFEESLAEKQSRMDEALAAFEALVEYEVADVTAAATYFIAETYLNFSRSLMASERPDGLSKAELFDYEMILEEEAYPFEERAIEVHQENFELLRAGVFNNYVEDSLGQLTELMPGRYAKNEISGGVVGTLDLYAYRKPNAPPEIIDVTLDAAVQDEPADPTEEDSSSPSAMTTEPN